jgi:hypothetical protein
VSALPSPDVIESTSLLARARFEAQSLVDAHPPRLVDRNKKRVYAVACPPGARHHGALTVSRWRPMDPPSSVALARAEATACIPREDVFDYAPAASALTAVEWHLNFACSALFCAYRGPMFAQDELQVAEHPALGSLREAMLNAPPHPQLAPRTRDVFGPTPVLIRGVERRCVVDIAPNASAGRPDGLYGARFGVAPPDDVTAATRALTPPTVSNILAMEAPTGGHGVYTLAQIRDVLVTAYTGFTAARVESQRASEGAVTVVHTGNWGTGAYGGNKALMALLQVLAARLAGVDRLVFHTHTAEGTAALREGEATLARLWLAGEDGAVAVGPLLAALEAMRFPWGVSDGN